MEIKCKHDLIMSWKAVDEIHWLSSGYTILD